MRWWIPLAFTILALHAKVPYDLERFRPVLDSCKLQAPTSKFDPCYGVKYGRFAGVSHKYFQLAGEELRFWICGKKHRSELRHREEWDVMDQAHMEAVVRLEPDTRVEEVTFLQIHSDPNRPPYVNKPLLRIAYRKNFRKRLGHCWAIVRTLPDLREYRKFDLGRCEGWMHWRVAVRDGLLTVARDREQIVLDVTGWSGVPNYFKAGVYLQSDGCASVFFKDLKMEVEHAH